MGTVAKLVAELAKLGYNAWRNNRQARHTLLGILMHVQDELNRNYKALQDAHNGSNHEWLETGVYGTAIEALNQALPDSPSVLDPLRRAYQLITPGLRARLTQGMPDGGGEEVVQLWALVGQASYEIDRWFELQGVVPSKFSTGECADREPEEFVGGWPRPEQVRVLTFWRRFIDACRAKQAREFTLNELGLSSMYADPVRELSTLARYAAALGFELHFTWQRVREPVANVQETVPA